MKKGTGYWVDCPSYTAGPFKARERAQLTLDKIERTPGGCTNPHTIIFGTWSFAENKVIEKTAPSAPSTPSTPSTPESTT